MRNVLVAMLMLAFLLSGLQLLPQAETAVFAQTGSGLPVLEYLGYGEADFNESDGGFIVKRLNPFRFDFEPGPEYYAFANEHVWRSQNTGGAPPAVYHSDFVVGPIPAGCVVRYIAIDDQIDDRINYFLLDDQRIHTMPQGMVISGEFIAPSAGILSYRANDSIGMYTDICSEVVTATPVKVVDTPQPDITPTPWQTTATPASTVLPTATPTVPPSYLACTRFNFDLGQNHDTGSLVPGLYTMREVGTGNTLATWWAAPAWEDSGWITDIYLTFPSVWVEVFFYPYGGEPAVNMNIINPANGTAYGWLAGGICHAIEIEFPLGWVP